MFRVSVYSGWIILSDVKAAVLPDPQRSAYCLGEIYCLRYMKWEIYIFAAVYDYLILISLIILSHELSFCGFHLKRYIVRSSLQFGVVNFRWRSVRCTMYGTQASYECSFTMYNACRIRLYTNIFIWKIMKIATFADDCWKSWKARRPFAAPRAQRKLIKRFQFEISNIRKELGRDGIESQRHPSNENRFSLRLGTILRKERRYGFTGGWIMDSRLSAIICRVKSMR